MYLLDTHTLIWFLTDSPELSGAARNTICSSTDIYVSYASLWEMSIKKSLGKLVFPYTFKQITNVCKEESIQLLGINYVDLDIVEKLPFIHRDPFDRLLIAQAKSRNITIITKDSIMMLRTADDCMSRLVMSHKQKSTNSWILKPRKP